MVWFFQKNAFAKRKTVGMLFQKIMMISIASENQAFS